ncbi:MAG: alpha/beta fold hydrolase [Acidimicrobiales bacterium]
MPYFEQGDVKLYYEEHGEGFPVLLIAPGGMRSAVTFWESAPWNPITELAGDHRVIAMDQRNAGRSRGPVSGDDGWNTYTADQLALLDHLGVDRFAVAGMCIGGPYIMALISAAPQRVAAGVVFQTIGLDDNRQAFYDMFDSWAAEIRIDHPEVSDDEWASFRQSMYGADDFLFTAGADEVRACETPLLVLLGGDVYHPESASRSLAELAPAATLIEQWKRPEHHEAAKAAVAEFLAANAH